MTDKFSELCRNWLKAKAIEAEAQKDRRSLEDKMVANYKIAKDFEGTDTFEVAGCLIKISGRIDRKVDSDKLQELAAENGLTDHLATLCRWKPEINMLAWKAADESITRLLSDAITAKPGRPSFAITVKE